MNTVTRPTSLEDIPLSLFDMTTLHLIASQADSSCDEYGSFKTAIFEALQQAFRQGFLKAWMDGEGTKAENPGALTPSGEEWEALQARAADIAANEYFTLHPEHKPENWDLNHTRTLLPLPADFKFTTEKLPKNQLIWGWFRNAWRVFHINDERELLSIEGDTEFDVDELIGYIPIELPARPDLHLIREVIEAEMGYAEVRPLISVVKEKFPSACDHNYGSGGWEVYAGEDINTSQNIGFGNTQLEAWQAAVTFAQSPAGQRLHNRMFRSGL